MRDFRHLTRVIPDPRSRSPRGFRAAGWAADGCSPARSSRLTGKTSAVHRVGPERWLPITTTVFTDESGNY